jgi:chorismate-pyruvate lyase
MSRITNARAAGHRSASAGGLLFPMDLLYKHAGVPPPKVRRISANKLPSPYRSLLVHEDSMTATLERHFGVPLGLRTLSTRKSAEGYFRRVLLVRSDTGRPVVMGAARISLGAFKPRVRARILENDVPLGRVLHGEGVDYFSRPLAFLAITPNPEMMGVFWMRDPHTLFGRRTDMIHQGKKIGDIVEILLLV